MTGRIQLDEAECWDVLRGVRSVHVAGVLQGRPLLRALNAAVVGRRIVVHGGPRGEKTGLAGAEVVVAAERVVAEVASWMRHPDRACPATTFFVSVQVRGRLVELADPVDKAAALQGFMEQLQPEGGHVPITADDPLYRAAVRGVRVYAVAPEEVVGVRRLGQDKVRREMRAVVRGLWRRGRVADLVAIEELVDVYPEPLPFHDVPDGVRPRCALRAADVDAAVALVADGYWNRGKFGVDVLARAHRGSTAWVGLERDGALVATARAISDHGKRAWVYDVAVTPEQRGTGLGTVLMTLLLDHVALRDVEVWLTTRDAMGFYERLGFEQRAHEASGPFLRTHMARPRPDPAMRG